MKERFDFEGTSTGEYREGLYVMYCGREYPAVYLGVGRFVLYSDAADENFTFPTQDGRYLLQTDLRDENLTRACDVHMIGIVCSCYESVTIRNILKEGVIVSTSNPRLGFELGLSSVKDLGFTGLVDRQVLAGIYEERDYLWNPALGICSTLCQATGTRDKDSWFIENDRIAQLYMMDSNK
ncbi:MAG: hypothetical protein K2G55_01945 [Lachnospiraceae bacterium]|nr:hypothetical protein [Lachnospiraceae bacterium]MDE7203431.1 hypothetical protein [Lachnospiraceae bacterium]